MTSAGGRERVVSRCCPSLKTASRNRCPASVQARRFAIPPVCGAVRPCRGGLPVTAYRRTVPRRPPGENCKKSLFYRSILAGFFCQWRSAVMEKCGNNAGRMNRSRSRCSRRHRGPLSVQACCRSATGPLCVPVRPCGDGMPVTTQRMPWKEKETKKGPSRCGKALVVRFCQGS